MSKQARSYRLHPAALEHLGVLQELTGSTQASVIEQALAVYRALLEEGISSVTRPARVQSDPAPDASQRAETPKNVEKRRREKPSATPRASVGWGPLFDD